MSTASTFISSDLGNHELNKVVEKMAEIFKISAVQAINAEANPSRYLARPREVAVGEGKSVPSVAAVVAKRFRALDAAQRRTVRLDLGRNTELTQQIRRLGVDIEQERSVLEQINLKQHFSFINDKNFSDARIQTMVHDMNLTTSNSAKNLRFAASQELREIESRFGSIIRTELLADIIRDVEAPASDDSGGGTIVLNRGLHFRIHEVRCVKKTQPDWSPYDEIAWGGVVVDDKEKVSKISEYRVPKEFKNSVRKIYDPPRKLKTFSLDGEYPKNFLVALILAEKDHEGLSEFIQELYEAIKADLKTVLLAVGGAAATALATAIAAGVAAGATTTAAGGTSGSWTGPLGIIIGLIIGALLGLLIGWLVWSLKDDIFPGQTAALHLQTAGDTFPDGTYTSPKLRFDYEDHGGQYFVFYDWHIIQ